ncbi:hypothetical protein [Saccharopolyspora shandongensis]|uniref:hypothetical protein n=1 Tax=Saccharopolyspora shandongensis TaxID=418495 RepID=UPI0011600A90|nr:hypothetical protein [Saccharopolyspora shandongensis]
MNRHHFDLNLDKEQQKQDILDSKPAGGKTTNWWLGLVQDATGRATFSETPDNERILWARAATASVECAEADGAITREESATRLANLSTVLLSNGIDPASVDENLEPNGLIHRCLDLIDLTYEQAAELAHNWQQRSIDTIRSLRRVKNLIRPLTTLVAHVRDDNLTNQATRWIELLPQLP